MPNLGEVPTNEQYTYIASGAIRRGYAVKLTTNENEVEECDAQGEASEGVALQTVADGEPVTVARRGRRRAVASGAIALHADVTPGTGGKYETAATSDVVAGKAMTATSNDLDEFIIELDTAKRVAP